MLLWLSSASFQYIERRGRSVYSLRISTTMNDLNFSEAYSYISLHAWSKISSLKSDSNNSVGDWHSFFTGLGSFQQKSFVDFISLCFQSFIYYFFEFFFEGFSVSFEGYIDFSFTYRLFFCLRLRFSPDDVGSSDLLLFDKTSLNIDNFLAFPS